MSIQCGPGSNPGVDAICGLNLLMVLSFVLRGFSLRSPVFPSSQKATFPIANSLLAQLRHFSNRTRIIFGFSFHI